MSTNPTPRSVEEWDALSSEEQDALIASGWHPGPGAYSDRGLQIKRAEANADYWKRRAKSIEEQLEAMREALIIEMGGRKAVRMIAEIRDPHMRLVPRVERAKLALGNASSPATSSGGSSGLTLPAASSGSPETSSPANQPDASERESQGDNAKFATQGTLGTSAGSRSETSDPAKRPT